MKKLRILLNSNPLTAGVPGFGVLVLILAYALGFLRSELGLLAGAPSVLTFLIALILAVILFWLLIRGEKK